MANDIFTQETVDKLNASALTFNEVVTSRAGGVSTGAIIDQTLTPLGETTDTLKGRLDKLGIIYTDWGSAIGGTLTTPAQAFLNNTVGSDGFGNYYSWSGVYPSGGHVVAPGTDPAAVGSGYTPRTDVAFRDELAAEGSSILISGRQAATVSLGSEIATSLSKVTEFSYRKQAINDSDLPYTAWPYGCTFVDVIDGVEYVMQAYTAGSGHVATDKKIFFRRMNYSGDGVFANYGARVAIDAVNSTMTVHACGKLQNGDYLAIARKGEPATATYVYKSVDKGLTWTNLGQMYADGSIVNPRECGQIFVTNSGAVLTAYGSYSGSAFVTRSTDNGATWSNGSAISVAATPGALPLEGSFIQLPDGKIVSIWRYTISSDFSVKHKALISVSIDDGMTWSAMQFTNIPDMNNNNASMIYHELDDIIEIIYCSRYVYPDGFSSLYQAFSTPSDIFNGQFFGVRRIPIGSGTRDFGYPSAVKMQDGTVICQFYNGNDYRTDIQMIAGRRPADGGIGSIPAMDYRLKNPFTSESHALYPSASGSEGRDKIGFNKVAFVRSKSVDTEKLRVRGDKNYFGTGVDLFNGAPSGTNSINAKSILEGSGLWNEDIGGLICTVRLEKTETLLVTVNIGAVFSGTFFSEAVGNKSSSANITVNTITAPMNTNDGTMQITTSTSGSLANIQNITVRAIGWTSKN